MYTLNTLYITDLVIEHLSSPIGVDCKTPRFGWKLHCDIPNTYQTSYHIKVFANTIYVADTGCIQSDQSIEVLIPNWETAPMTSYEIEISVTDNHGHTASAESSFETGRLGIPFRSQWIEPIQEPTPPSMYDNRDNSDNMISADPYVDGKRDFHEFRPAQYIRIPFHVCKDVKAARIYTAAHGLYHLEINGRCPDNREFAPENTSYNKLLLYQTYDVTKLLHKGENVVGSILADGWWVGRVGTTGDCCQYGDTLGMLLDLEIEYMDGSKDFISGEQGFSSPGPIIFSDLFVGEKYDATKELSAWSTPMYDQRNWQPVRPVDYPTENLAGQCTSPVRPIKVFRPLRIFQAANGETILDAGQVLAGQIEITLTAAAGHTITFEHSEVLDKEGNFFNNILNVNKEQTDIYITKAGRQTYRPFFTYHGFRYVRITGWPGRLSLNNIKIFALTSEMENIGYFSTSDERINQLQRNIWWSQISNTLSIPTDCPQREKAGWTGDIMAFAPTLCFNRDADTFLSSWMNNLRADQLENGAVPMIVPYLKAYQTFIKGNLGADTSCGWGDAVIIVPYTVYMTYGDKKILTDNYDSMTRWLQYIDDRTKNHHPAHYEAYDDERKVRDGYLWNTDFHFGDWLIPSMVLNNPDANAMNETAYATMGIVGPAYYAFSAKKMGEIAEILGKEEDEVYYKELYQKIRNAFIMEYVHEDGTLDANFQGIYVIVLQMGLVPDDIRPNMVTHLCNMIQENGNRLDTGFLSVLFLMDVLCENGRSDVAYRLLFQTSCPSWLYEVVHGGTTIWESWGAIGEDGTVSTYSYNHYAFGCIGDWMYRHLGGLQMIEPGYKRFKVAPAFNCGLTSVTVSEETPYGKIGVSWSIADGWITLHVTAAVNTEAVIDIPGKLSETVRSGSYHYIFKQ